MTVGRIKRKLKKTVRAYSKPNREVDAAYKRSIEKLDVKRASTTKLAVVMHLFYTESWELFKKHLVVLDGINFDLFVTLPTTNLPFVDEIKRMYPNAYIIEVSNKGRDVLPFINAASVVYKNGYSYLLKIHSKKSTHRTDGGDWLTDIIECLLPNDKVVLQKLFKTLDKDQTGVVGPKNQYYPLTVNFEANGEHMRVTLNKLFNRTVSYDVLQLKRKKHGFFAGTMFWARLDAIGPLLDQHYRAKDFEPEKGQLDGTFAHALERLFCLVPEVNHRNIYEISPSGVDKISYASDNIPDWSNVYIGPKNK